MARRCFYPNCTNPVFSNNYCRIHQSRRTDEKFKKAVSNANTANRIANSIKNYSTKRTAINKIYSLAAKTFIKLHPLCQIRIKGVCTNISNGIHHVKGRATTELLLNQDHWLSACNSCNLWAEVNSLEAKETGIKLPDYNSKLSKFKK